MSATPAQRAGVRLTARGAIVVVVATTLAGELLASVFGWSFAVGATFVAGCLAAALLINPRDLLSLVVTPPLLFFAATLIAELVRAIGAASMIQALGLGLFTSLSAGAPWLFAGSALVLGVAWRRGLPGNVRTLREELRAARAGGEEPRKPAAATPAAQVFVPEPEGYFEPKVYGRHRDTAEGPPAT
ncbi:hypothetical protein C1I98_08625 [Spongiactinospora gelatinilytica]|uniref:DUF6542 domain-containing protein n=1 Tax=Spongiactinospora gelatinilytica TaxID=2666298 RepID=A0A2W2GU30_9ACTN|nr:DUF6542 domain-containing protein [Spongiactinospora gelatinilytica]PZG51432.1 hypothetical protein C1I98_08625 [Spongiactinospora gelatinilytica]